jgi:hypothetical protein
LSVKEADIPAFSMAYTSLYRFLSTTRWSGGPYHAISWSFIMAPPSMRLKRQVGGHRLNRP